jgi:sulfate adenylyltransferase subunit 2
MDFASPLAIATRRSERQGRLIDRDDAGSLERKMREGYF